MYTMNLSIVGEDENELRERLRLYTDYFVKGNEAAKRLLKGTKTAAHIQEDFNERLAKK